MSDQTMATTPAQRPTQVGYLAIGLTIGGAWLLGSSVPPWEHALRLLVVVVVIPPLVHLLRRRRGSSHSAQPPLRYLVVAKVLLVAAALVVDMLLAQWTTAAEAVTGLMLALTVALGGPPLHRRLQP